jgi:hypothetical protein
LLVSVYQHVQPLDCVVCLSGNTEYFFVQPQLFQNINHVIVPQLRTRDSNSIIIASLYDKECKVISTGKAQTELVNFTAHFLRPSHRSA